MKNIEDDCILISNHYRRSLFFEQSMARLYNDGFKHIIVQLTGQGPNASYHGPAQYIDHSYNKSYDAGMAHFKVIPQLAHAHQNVVVLLDNDLFFTRADLFRSRVEAFAKSDLDFSSYFVSPKSYENRKETNGFHEVNDQKFEPSEHYPYFFPEPHWENAFLMIKKSMWDKLQPEDVSHGRLWLRALVRENAKMAAHKVNYRGSHSHYADDFFHVGHLFSYYNYVENNQMNKFSPDSAFDLQRLGYFAAQERSFGNCHTSSFQASLDAIYQHVGGKDKALAAWDQHIEGTCMAGWDK